MAKHKEEREGYTEVFTPFITKKGVRIYKKGGGVFHFWAKNK